MSQRFENCRVIGEIGSQWDDRTARVIRVRARFMRDMIKLGRVIRFQPLPPLFLTAEQKRELLRKAVAFRVAEGSAGE